MSKRANFTGIQQTHYVPIAESEPSRVRSGFEGIVASRTRPPFAYTAEDDGVIEALDEIAQVIKIRFNNGRVITTSYGEEYTNNTGLYINQKIVVNGFKVGDKVRKGDIVTYNKEFFQADPYSKQVNFKMGVLAKIAFLDNGGTLEDASVLTSALAKKMQFEPVHMKEIEITTDTHVHAFAAVGTYVRSTDPLMVFDESAIDFDGKGSDELADLLSYLNKLSPKAEHTGTVVKVEALYKAPLSQMHSSLQKIIKSITVKKDQRAAFAAGSVNADEFQKSQPLYATDKVGTIDLEPTTVVLRFYIKQIKSMDPGDKLFWDNCLKSVVSDVVDEITTESGEQVEGMTSCRGVLARIISSPFLQGMCNGVLHRLEDNVLAVWDNGTK